MKRYRHENPTRTRWKGHMRQWACDFAAERRRMEEAAPEAIRADTPQALTFEQMVQALDRISTPMTAKDEPLPFDPDDYPVV